MILPATQARAAVNIPDVRLAAIQSGKFIDNKIMITDKMETIIDNRLIRSFLEASVSGFCLLPTTFG